VKKLLVIGLGSLTLCSVGSAFSNESESPSISAKGPVRAIAADGGRAAFVVHSCRGHATGCSDSEGCATVRAWTPATGRSTPLEQACPDGFCATSEIALAGTRAAWLETCYGTTFKETGVMTATLARPRPLQVAYASTTEAYKPYGNTALAPVGDGQLLVFTVETRCESPEKGGDGPQCPPDRKDRDVIRATIWRVAGVSRCPSDQVVRRCTRVAEATNELTALAVDASRIVVRTGDGVSLITPSGRHVRDLPVRKVQDAALSGDQLALRVKDAIEIYDTRTGEIVKKFPVAGLDRLEDLENGILVTTVRRVVMLRRVSDGRSARIRARGIAHAQLEPSGLFVAGARRVTFTPMRGVLRLLVDAR
jgi:hypothetical protein